MLVARWYCTARFGHKAEVIALLKEWDEQVAPHVGVKPEQQSKRTGAVGAAEAQIESEIRVESFAELDHIFSKMATLDFMKGWSQRLGDVVVSGSTRWEIFRAL